MVHIKARAELVQHFEACRSSLESSSAGYDLGSSWEAGRLATATSVMVHDGKRNSRSILTQLGLLASMKFYSYLHPANNALLPEYPLTMIAAYVGERVATVPVFDRGPLPPSLVQFATWEGETVFSHDGTHLNRRGLVSSLRDQDGGSHVDASLKDPAYISMKFTGPKLTVVESGKQLSKIIGEEHATMRHIAFELLESLKLLGAIK